ncbi:MAG TPA: SRPBCC domain-containing protein [Trebonia sp.]|nr:SRPBCC domain-containing protein [Trebonia sp.]
MSEIRIVRDYPYPVARVWRALTDPGLIPRWTATGAGARPEGFAPIPGTRFRFVAKPKPGWNGIVNCEVLEASEPVLLRYTWTDDGGVDTVVTYRLEPVGDGTRFTYEHTGFTGAGGCSCPRCWAVSAARCSATGCKPHRGRAAFNAVACPGPGAPR